MNEAFPATGPVACRWCGKPGATSRNADPSETFCCLGCALRARIPVDADGQFPVNGQLVSVLVVGFFYFNQLLFWTLGTFGGAKLGAVLSARMLWAAAVAALLMWLAVWLIQRREKCASARDAAVSVLVVTVHGVSVFFSDHPGLCMAAANAGLLVWSARGLLTKRKTVV